MRDSATQAGRSAIGLRVAGILAGAFVALVLAGWVGLDFREPISFHGDHLLTLGNARAYVDGHGFRWNDHLGFPGRRDHLFHAGFYFSQRSILWLSARVNDNPATVVHTFYGIGIVLLYVACYWSLRRLTISPPLAWLGSVVFVVTPYFAVRAGMHDMLSVYYSVPLGAVLALRLAMTASDAGSRPSRTGLRDPLPWALVLAVSASGLYYAFFTTLFVSFLGLVAARRTRSAAPVVHAAVLCAAVVLALLVTGTGLGLIDILQGDVTLPSRLSIEQRIYGLVPGDAMNVLPYVDAKPAGWPIDMDTHAPEGSWAEWPGVMLTLTIALSPLIGIWALVARWSAAEESRRQLVILCAACLTVGVLFAARGSLGLIFNQVVAPAIRAQNRITPFLTFFALVILLVLLERAVSAARGWRKWAAIGVIAGGLLISTWPSIGALRAKQEAFLNDPDDQGDRASIRAMLDQVHALGLRTVLQLPIVKWPEAPRVQEFVPYRFELPYILDVPGSAVRWSYGLSDRQREFHILFRAIAGHREEGLAAAATRLGYDAVLFEKAALAPADLAVWLAGLDREPSVASRAYDDDRRVLYRVRQALR